MGLRPTQTPNDRQPIPITAIHAPFADTPPTLTPPLATSIIIPQQGQNYFHIRCFMTTQAKAPAAPETQEVPAYTPQTRKFTVAEYYRMAEVGILKPDERVELIEGEIIVMAPIGPEHADDVNEFIAVFGPHSPGPLPPEHPEPGTPG